MNDLRCLTAGLCFFVSSACFAIDPVSWSLSPANGVATTSVGNQSQVTYTFTNNLPLPVSITPQWDARGGNFHVHDLCQGQQVAANGQCQIIIAFAPKDEGNHAIQLTYNYHNNSIPLPALNPSISPTPASQAISGGIYGLPPVVTLQPQQTPDFTITYTNRGDTDISGYAGDAGGMNQIIASPAGKANITLLENNCGTFAAPFNLKAKQSCTVKGKLTPVSASAVTVQGLYTYDAGTKTLTPSASTEIKTGDGSCGLAAFVHLPLATQVYQYSDNLVEYEFKNTCSGSAINVGQVTISSTMNPSSATGPIINKSSDHDACSGKTLSALSSCKVLVSVTPQATATSMSVQAKATANNKTATAVTAAAVAANNKTQHIVHFNNQCSFNVWYGIANGTGGLFSPDPTPGSQSSSGASSNAYLVAAQQPGVAPSHVDLSVSEYKNGAIWPRINCELNAGQLVCESGMCATLNNSGTCVKMGNNLAQPMAPYTKFEFTIVSTPGGDGVYDVSVINGMNVPVEIKGLGPTNSTDPFICTGTGAPIQTSGNRLGSCPWTFDPTFSGLSTPDFVWVSAGADDNCSTDGDCAAGEICGMAFDVAPPANPSKINRRCGLFLGYSTAANYYGYPLAGQWGSKNLYSQFNIATPMTTINPQATYGSVGGNPATFGALLACTPTSNNSANTCYNTASNLPTCCGCVNWNENDSPVKTAVSQACNNINNDWTTTASTSITPKNAITWLKKGCPTAYAYQFDDKSSSYTCTKGSRSENLMTNYQITFCPGGLSSLPSGATEHR